MDMRHQVVSHTSAYGNNRRLQYESTFNGEAKFNTTITEDTAQISEGKTRPVISNRRNGDYLCSKIKAPVQKNLPNNNKYHQRCTP
jgi:hypothetical protein